MGITRNYSADYKVVARIMDGTTVVGYVIMDRKGSKQPVKKKVFEEMAMSKQIYNCVGHIYNGKVNLRGVGNKLKELPSVQVNSRLK